MGLFVFCFGIFLVYPRVKVKVQDQDDQSGIHDHKISSVLSLKDVLFLSMLDSYVPVKRLQDQDVCPMPTRRFPKPFAPDAEKPLDSTPEEKNKRKTDEVRPNIRVSSTPRPRAVISSPDNDAVVGNKNKMKGNCTALKNNNTVPNRHTIRTHIFARSPLKTKTSKSKDDEDCNVEIKENKGSVTTASSRRTDRKIERPSWQDP